MNLQREKSNKMFRQFIDTEIERDYNGSTDVIEYVDKCIKHIECLCCLDTRKVLFTSEAWFGGTYEEFSCPACRNRERLDSHHQIYHAQVNGRQVPYNGGDSKVCYSRVMQLCDIYRRNYQQSDILEEENERKKRADALAAETIRLENEKLMGEEEKRKRPSWEFMDNKELCAEIGSVDASVDISNLVGDISKLMAMQAGNLLALPAFLDGLDVTLKYYWANENTNNSFIHKIKDCKDEEVYIKVEYHKIKQERQGVFGILRMNGNSKKERLNVSYFIAKPTKNNEAAEKICNNLMNVTIQNVIDKLKK